MTFYSKHKEKMLNYQKEYNEINREHINLYYKSWYRKNRKDLMGSRELGIGIREYRLLNKKPTRKTRKKYIDNRGTVEKELTTNFN